MQTQMQKALAEYVVQDQNKFYRLAYSYVGNSEAAKDVVQNAVLKGIESIGSLRNMEYMGTWFYRILVNESISFLRKNQRELSCDFEEMLRVTEKAAPDEQHESEVMEQVLKLPPDLKTVILLRFYEDMPLQRIAEITGVKLSTVKYRLYRALELLKKQIKEVSA